MKKTTKPNEAKFKCKKMCAVLIQEKGTVTWRNPSIPLQSFLENILGTVDQNFSVNVCSSDVIYSIS